MDNSYWKLGWTNNRDEHEVKSWSSIAVWQSPLPPLSPYNKNIYHFQQCNKCFQCIIHIYTDMSPRFKCVSHHTCVSSPRGGSSRVLCVHTCIYIRIYINTCVWTTCKPPPSPPRLELRHYRCGPKNYRNKEELETAVVDHEYQAVSVFAGGAPVDLAPCPSMDFTCSDGSCILKSSVCDGFDDCPRAEDELHCGILNTYVSCEAITTPGKI